VNDSFFVDVWSDVVCPFCYLGSPMFAAALGDFEHREHVVVRHRAFELDPRSASSYDLSLNELVAQKYGITVERARSINERLEAQALTLQMTWALQDAKVTNTFDAHRLITLAQSQGLGDQMNERVFRAHFSEGRHLGDHDTLSTLAADVGVDDLWRSDEYSLDVRRDEREAQELGISGVPAMLLDGTFMIVGAQGADAMLDALRRAWARRSAA
jgi:predicted DsbA family dithiol-disulfide isomerase